MFLLMSKQFGDFLFPLDKKKKKKFLYVPQKKDVIQVWNDMGVSNWWQNFNLCVNYPFKFLSLFKS